MQSICDTFFSRNVRLVNALSSRIHLLSQFYTGNADKWFTFLFSLEGGKIMELRLWRWEQTLKSYLRELLVPFSNTNSSLTLWLLCIYFLYDKCFFIFLAVNIHVDISRIQIIKSSTVYFQAPFGPPSFVPPTFQSMLALERAHYAVPAICNGFLFILFLLSFFWPLEHWDFILDLR